MMVVSEVCDIVCYVNLLPGKYDTLRIKLGKSSPFVSAVVSFISFLLLPWILVRIAYLEREEKEKSFSFSLLDLGGIFI